VSTQPDRVRWPFRILAFILGPICIVGGIAILAVTAWDLATEGWEDWRAWLGLASAGISALTLGPLLIRAARSGRDPMVSDEDL